MRDLGLRIVIVLEEIITEKKVQNMIKSNIVKIEIVEDIMIISMIEIIIEVQIGKTMQEIKIHLKKRENMKT